MLPRSGHAVTGDADEAHEAGVARLGRGTQRAVSRERGLPLVLRDEVVELDEIDVVDAESLQRSTDLVLCLGVRALAGLRREEEVIAVVALQPRRDAQL